MNVQTKKNIAEAVNVSQIIPPLSPQTISPPNWPLHVSYFNSWPLSPTPTYILSSFTRSYKFKRWL